MMMIMVRLTVSLKIKFYLSQNYFKKLSSNSVFSSLSPFQHPQPSANDHGADIVAHFGRP